MFKTRNATLKTYLTKKNSAIIGQKLSKTAKEPYLREQFFKLKCRYRSTSRKEKRTIKQNTLQKLVTLYFSNNDDFWNVLKQMKRSTFDKQLNDETLSPVQDLSEHYKELLQRKHNSTRK